MTWKPDYCTTAELKAQLRITDTDDDLALAVAVTSASRAIDQHCNRQFGSVSPAAARVYTWDGECLDGRQALVIDDVQNVTGLGVEIWDSEGDLVASLTNGTDFDLYPWNAAADGKPFTHLVLRPGAVATFPCHARGVEVTALFGWTAVPSLVKQAALIQAARFFVRRNAPFGIAGSPDAGSEMRLLDRVDPDVAVLLLPVRRVWGAA